MSAYLREERIQELMGLIAARSPPRRLEVSMNGETMQHEAMELARLYARYAEAARRIRCTG